MRNVMQKAQELAEAVVASDLYTRMKQLEEEVAQDPEASGAMNNMIAKRKRVEEVLSTKNMKPDDLAQASLEMEAAETAMNSSAMFPALRPIFLSRIRVIMGQTMEPMLVTMFPKNST